MGSVTPKNGNSDADYVSMATQDAENPGSAEPISECSRGGSDSAWYHVELGMFGKYTEVFTL